MILAGGAELLTENFALESNAASLVSQTGAVGLLTKEGLEITEKQMILDALKRAGGNKTEAAKLLKITRRRLYSRMKYHNIKP